jgi:hypothetical protein
MHGGGDGAVQRGVQIAPFARGQLRRQRQAHRGQHGGRPWRIGREQLADQRDGRLVLAAWRGRWTGPSSASVPGIAQHRAGQHVLRFRVGRHAEARARRCR